VSGLKRALSALLSIIIFSSVCYGAFETETLYVTGLTNNRLVATGSDSDKDIVSVSNLCSWIAGTANQIVCTDDGDGTITLDFPDAVAITTSLTVPLILGSGGTGNNLTLNSNSANDGQIILGNATTGLVYNEDDEAATIGGGEIVHTINGSNEKSLFEFHQDGNTAPGGVSFHRHTNTAASSSDIVFIRSRGDHSTPLIVQNGDELGHIRATGYDGTDEAESSGIKFEVDTTPGNDDMGGRVIVETSADGTQTPIEALRIDSSQDSLFSGDIYRYGGTGNNLQLYSNSANDGLIKLGSKFQHDENTGYGIQWQTRVKTDQGFFGKPWLELEQTTITAVDNDEVVGLISPSAVAAGASPTGMIFVGHTATAFNGAFGLFGRADTDVVSDGAVIQIDSRKATAAGSDWNSGAGSTLSNRDLLHVANKGVKKVRVGPTGSILTVAGGFLGVGRAAYPTIAAIEAECNTTSKVGLGLWGDAGQLADMVRIYDSTGNIHNKLSLPGAASPENVFNEQGGDLDFRVEGDTEDKLFLVDAGNDEVRQGDGDANYVSVGKTGVTTFVGTARVEKELTFSLDGIGKGATAPTLTRLDNTFGWAFGIGDDGYLSFEVPLDWDNTDTVLNGIRIRIHVYVDEDYDITSGEMQWQGTWSSVPEDGSEAVDGATHTGTLDSGDINISTTAKGLTEVTVGTIAKESISKSPHDQIFILLSRVAVDDGVEVSAEPVVVRAEYEWIANTLGETL